MAAFDPSRATVHKGRGATYDPHNRFAPTRSVAEDDGWWQEEATTSPVSYTHLTLPTIYSV